MDSSSPPPNNPQHHNYTSYDNNWLAFSLNPSPDLSLFHPFFPPPPSPGNNFPQEQDASAAAVGGAAGDYTTPGPKLENFLAGSVIYPGGPGPDASAAFYGTRRAEAVGAGLMHGFITAPPEEYINTMNYNRQQQDPPLEVSASETPPPPPPSGPKKAGDSFGHRTSIYRGVTRHRWTGRYEAHLWDNSCKREGQSRKGRQVYLGGYDKEEKAARAYDLAALKYWGATTTTNFPVLDYEKELEEMKHMSRQEFVASLRRKSSGFSRGASIYRGVTRHHQHGRWQARIGRVAGNKDLYLGTFSTQEEAAEAYDIAAIKFRGGNAVTNFDISRYDVKSIANNNLPVGGLSIKSSKAATSSSSSLSGSFDNDKNVLGGTFQYHFPTSSTTLSFATDPTEQQTLCWPHHREQTSPEFNMDASGGGSFFGYGDHPQTTTATAPTTSCADVSFAVPMSSSGSGGDGGRTCAAKANLSALHTLIFGME